MTLCGGLPGRTEQGLYELWLFLSQLWFLPFLLAQDKKQTQYAWTYPLPHTPTASPSSSP